MVEFEVKQTLEVPAKLNEITNHFKMAKPIYESDFNNNAIEEHVRKFIWNETPYYFIERYLTAMVRVITKLGHFENWQDFCHQFGKKRFAQQALQLKPIKVIDDDQRTFSDSDIKLVMTWVERDLEGIRKRRSQEGYLEKPKHNLALEELEHLEFSFDKNYTFRYATTSEISRIANLARRIYPCPINDFNVKKPWHDKNPKIFIICEDEFGKLVANINMLPRKENFYQNLKIGVCYEDELQPDDIYSMDEK